jgi:hypothetical protein
VTSKDVTSERAARLSNGGIAPLRATDQNGDLSRRSVTLIVPQRAMLGMAGTTPMHVFSNVFDYIALGVLIACMLAAAAMVFARVKTH